MTTSRPHSRPHSRAPSTDNDADNDRDAHAIHGATDTLRVAAMTHPANAALNDEVLLEDAHAVQVHQQLHHDSDSDESRMPLTKEIIDTTLTFSDDTQHLAVIEEGSADLTTAPVISPVHDAAGEMLVKPTEMTGEELKSHMADLRKRVEIEAEEVERRRQLMPSAGDIIIQPGRHDRLVRSVFGFTLHCKCVINDEVRMTVWILVIVGVIAMIGFFLAKVDYTLDSATLKLHERLVALTVGGVFSFLATVLSIVQIRAHRRNWVHPPSQRCVIKILLMVPVYATSAWLSLVFLQYALYIDFVRMCYEALVIYQFMILLTKYLGGQAGVIEWLKTKGPQKWPSPLNYLFKPVTPNAKFMAYLKYGTLQYAVITPFVSVIAMALNTFDLYCDGVFSFECGYPYIALVQNCTQVLSLYCLVWLYMVMKNELQPFKPMSKFLVVKSVVFFTFWQAVGLSILVKASVITETPDLDVGEVQIGLQDFLICIEMFLAAAAHKYTFGTEQYADGSMKLLMDQRQMYLAQQSYDRAKEKQRLAEEAYMEAERRRLGINQKKKKKKKKNQLTISTEKPVRAISGDTVLNIEDDDNHLITPVLDPVYDDDDDDTELTRSQRISRESGVPRSMLKIKSLSQSDKGVEMQSVGDKPSILRPSALARSFMHMRTGSNHALQAAGNGALKVAKGAKHIIAPVTKVTGLLGLTNDNDEALVDDDWDDDRQRPVFLSAEQRRDLDERIRREAEDEARKRRDKREKKLKREADKKSALFEKLNNNYNSSSNVSNSHSSSNLAQSPPQSQSEPLLLPTSHPSVDDEDADEIEDGSDSEGEGEDRRGVGRERRTGHQPVPTSDDFV